MKIPQNLRDAIRERVKAMRWQYYPNGAPCSPTDHYLNCVCDVLEEMMPEPSGIQDAISQAADTWRDALERLSDSQQRAAAEGTLCPFCVADGGHSSSGVHLQNSQQDVSVYTCCSCHKTWAGSVR